MEKVNVFDTSARKIYEILPLGEMTYQQIVTLIKKQLNLNDKQIEARIGHLKKLGAIDNPKRGFYIKHKKEFTEIKKTKRAYKRRVQEIPVKAVFVKNEVGLIRKFWRWIY